MSIIKCKECAGEVSSTAKACPKCGAKVPKRTSMLTKLLALILIPGMLLAVFSTNQQTEKLRAEAAAIDASLTPEQRAAKQEADERLNAGLLRGRAMVRLIKQNAKNPDSIKIESAFLTTAGAVCINYRGTNSFNAVVPGLMVLPSDASSKSATAEQTPTAWNKHCAKTPGRDITSVL